MSDCNYNRSNQKGIVLVAALLITSILFLLALSLSYNMASFLKAFSAVRDKTQTYYTSIAGAEQLRNYMGNQYDKGLFAINNSLNWNNQLGLSSNPSNSAYQDKTATITGMTNPTIAGTNYKIYFRDNEDGDDDYTVDNDQIILASIESQDSATGTKTTVEAMLIFAGGDSYQQQGKGASKGNRAKGTGTDTLNVRQTF